MSLFIKIAIITFFGIIALCWMPVMVKEFIGGVNILVKLFQRGEKAN